MYGRSMTVDGVGIHLARAPFVYLFYDIPRKHFFFHTFLHGFGQALEVTE